MPGYDRQYDYGMRGFHQTTRPITPGGGPRSLSDRPYLVRYDAGLAHYANQWGLWRPPMPRYVTAPYNRDYVTGPRGERYPRNYNMYGGDRMDRIGDSRYFRQPYLTSSGTRTLRGSSFPTGYDYPDYLPDYGGRYPDEL